MRRPSQAPLLLHRPKKVAPEATGAILPQSGKVSAASAADSGNKLTGDRPLRPHGVRPFASPKAMDSDDEIMMEVLQDDEAEATTHLHRWNMGFAFLMQLRQQINDVVPRRGGSLPDKAVNKNRHRDAGAIFFCTLTALQMMQKIHQRNFGGDSG
jgi:hypothetical protein